MTEGVVDVKFCKPIIRGLRTQDGSPYALGKWEWAARCREHGTSWTTGGNGKWPNALSAAIAHQWEWAEVRGMPAGDAREREQD